MPMGTIRSVQITEIHGAVSQACFACSANSDGSNFNPHALN